MRPIYINLSPIPALYISPPIVLDQYVAPANVIVVLAVKGAGSVPLKLEFTTDDIFDPTATLVWQPYTATPFNATGQLTLTASGNPPAAAAEASIEFAPRAFRVSVTGAVTGGSPLLSIQVIQLGVASV